MKAVSQSHGLTSCLSPKKDKTHFLEEEEEEEGEEEEEVEEEKGEEEGEACHTVYMIGSCRDSRQAV